MRKRILIGLGVFVLVLVAAWVVADRRYAAALEASIEKIRAAGDPVTRDELMAAAKPAEPGVGAGGRVADFFYGDLADTGREISRSRFAEVGENLVWDDDSLSVDIAKVWEEWSPEIEADARKVVEANDAFLDRIHEIAALPLEEPGVMLYKSGHDRATLHAFRLPDLQSIGGVTNLLSLETVLAAKAGDEPAIARALLHQIRWARHVESTSEMLIGAMIAISVKSIAANSILRTVQAVPFSPESVAALDEELIACGGYDRIVAAYKVERLYRLDFHNAAASDTGTEDSAQPAISILTSMLYRPWVNYDTNAGLELYGQLLPCTGERYTVYRNCRAALEGQIEQLGWPALLTSMILPSLLRSRIQVDETQALLGLARVALALNRFHADTGAYPETLEPLAPAHIESLPPDPFTDAPFTYQREGGGYVMYSTGSPDDGPKGGPDERLSVRVR